MDNPVVAIQRELDIARTDLRSAREANKQLEAKLITSVPKDDFQKLQKKAARLEEKLKARDESRVRELENEVRRLSALEQETRDSYNDLTRDLKDLEDSNKSLMVQLQEAERQAKLWRAKAEEADKPLPRPTNGFRIRKSQRSR